MIHVQATLNDNDQGVTDGKNNDSFSVNISVTI